MKKLLLYAHLILLVVVLLSLFRGNSFEQVFKQHRSPITIVAAGDIAIGGGKQKQTSDLVLSLNPDKVLTLGDNVYENGTLSEFNSYYEPTWGRFKSKTVPSPGNHEYHTPDASGYFDYFGDLAGERGKGYYSFDLGSWHIISLNSERINKEELDWLTRDLSATKKPCILAYWHKPLFSSGQHGNDGSIKPFWDILYSKGADIILNGHEHNYERFAKQDPSGTLAQKGIRQFIVGTGGAPQRAFNNSALNSEARATGEYGVLLFTLDDGSYSAVLKPAEGSSFIDVVRGERCN